MFAAGRGGGRRVQPGVRLPTCSALLRFVQASQIPISQIVANPKTGHANHVIQNGLAPGYQAPRLGFGEDSEKAGDCQTAVDRDRSATLLVDEEKLGVQFGCDHGGFGLTGVEFEPSIAPSFPAPFESSRGSVG